MPHRHPNTIVVTVLPPRWMRRSVGSVSPPLSVLVKVIPSRPVINTETRPNTAGQIRTTVQRSLVPVFIPYGTNVTPSRSMVSGIPWIPNTSTHPASTRKPIPNCADRRVKRCITGLRSNAIVVSWTIGIMYVCGTRQTRSRGSNTNTTNAINVRYLHSVESHLI